MSLLALEFNPIIAGKQIRDIFFISKTTTISFYLNFAVLSQSMIEKIKSNQIKVMRSLTWDFLSYFPELWK